MHLIDTETAHQRRMAVQDVIDLVQANGKAYLKALSEFNSGFPKNPNNMILNHNIHSNEQTIPFRAV